MSNLTLGEIANLKMVGLNNNVNSVNNVSGMSRARDILEFMQELSKTNPTALKDTTMEVLCSSYLHWTKKPIKLNGATSCFIRLVKNNIIIKYNKTWHRACFKINYFHPSLGASFIQNASDEDKQEISKALESLKEKQKNGENTTIDEFGAITTKILNHKPEEPKPEEPKEPKEVKESEEPKELEELKIAIPTNKLPEYQKAPWDEFVNERSEQTVPVKVEKTPNGINLSITLNLNIN